MKTPTKRASLKEIEAQIDWKYINEIKKDPKKWEKFLEEGRKLGELIDVLQEIKESQK